MAKNEKVKTVTKRSGVFKLQYYPNNTGIIDNETFRGQVSKVDTSTYETIPQKLARMQKGDYTGLAGSNDMDFDIDDKDGKVSADFDDVTRDPDFDMAHYGALAVEMNARNQARIDARELEAKKQAKLEEKAKFEAEKKAKQEREDAINELLKQNKK